MTTKNEFYLMGLRNICTTIKSRRNKAEVSEGGGIEAFSMLTAISIAWAKRIEDVTSDYLEVVKDMK